MEARYTTCRGVNSCEVLSVREGTCELGFVEGWLSALLCQESILMVLWLFEVFTVGLVSSILILHLSEPIA